MDTGFCKIMKQFKERFAGWRIFIANESRVYCRLREENEER